MSSQRSMRSFRKNITGDDGASVDRQFTENQPPPSPLANTGRSPPFSTAPESNSGSDNEEEDLDVTSTKSPPKAAPETIRPSPFGKRMDLPDITLPGGWDAEVADKQKREAESEKRTAKKKSDKDKRVKEHKAAKSTSKPTLVDKATKHPATPTPPPKAGSSKAGDPTPASRIDPATKPTDDKLLEEEDEEMADATEEVVVPATAPPTTPPRQTPAPIFPPTAVQATQYRDKAPEKDSSDDEETEAEVESKKNGKRPATESVHPSPVKQVKRQRASKKGKAKDNSSKGKDNQSGIDKIANELRDSSVTSAAPKTTTSGPSSVSSKRPQSKPSKVKTKPTKRPAGGDPPPLMSATGPAVDFGDGHWLFLRMPPELRPANDAARGPTELEVYNGLTADAVEANSVESWQPCDAKGWVARCFTKEQAKRADNQSFTIRDLPVSVNLFRSGSPRVFVASYVPLEVDYTLCCQIWSLKERKDADARFWFGRLMMGRSIGPKVMAIMDKDIGLFSFDIPTQPGKIGQSSHSYMVKFRAVDTTSECTVCGKGCGHLAWLCPLYSVQYFQGDRALDAMLKDKPDLSQ